MRKTISVVIPTYNGKDVIKPCLESIKWADEIIVVDMFSDDGTVEICKEFDNVKVFQRHDYIFGNVNFGIKKAGSDWIMRFDHDEIMTDELKKEIFDVLEKDGYGYDGFYCRSRLIMFGKEVKHGVGGKHTYRKQIFKNGYAWYQLIDIHEVMTSKGRWGYLKNPYLHYTCDSIKQFFEKAKYYARLSIEEPWAQTHPAPAVYVTVYKCIRFFILFYIQWYGFLDGWHGLLVSFLRSFYYWHEDRIKRIYKKKKRIIKTVEKHRDKILNSLLKENE